MTTPRSTAAACSRVRKDVIELTQQRFICPHATTLIEFPEGESNLLNIRATIVLSGGYYTGGTFTLSLRVPSNYPFRPPAVVCETRVWHPNVSLETGRVSHPLLDRDWKPVLSINTVIFGLQLLFLEPNVELAANELATRSLLADRGQFQAEVRQTLRGGHWFGIHFPVNQRVPSQRRGKRARNENECAFEECAMDLQGDVVALTLRDDDHDDRAASCFKRSCTAASATFAASPLQPRLVPPTPLCRQFNLPPHNYPIALVSQSAYPHGYTGYTGY